MAVALGSVARLEDSPSPAEVVPADIHDTSLHATRASTQGSREALSRRVFWPKGH